jgi:hypothetical protein
LGVPVEYQERLERLLDVLFQLPAAGNPSLGTGGRLRPLVRCWLGSILRFWDKIVLDLGHDHPFLAAVRVSVVTVGLAGPRPGDADAWITTAGVTVRERFIADNRSISTLPGGEGGMASVVATQANMSSTCAQLGASVVNLSSDFRVFKNEIKSDVIDLKRGVAEILQYIHRASNAPPRAPPMTVTPRLENAAMTSVSAAGVGSTSTTLDAVSSSPSSSYASSSSSLSTGIFLSFSSPAIFFSLYFHHDELFILIRASQTQNHFHRPLSI